MKAILYAPVRRATGATRHYVGVPPLEAGQPDEREQMRTARILLATVAEEGHYLYRLDDHCKPAGDTWHPTLLEVKEQAIFEYEVDPTDWLDIPEDRSDLMSAIQYVRALLAAE